MRPEFNAKAQSSQAAKAAGQILKAMLTKRVTTKW